MRAAEPERLTFLYTDMEGSSLLWERHPELMAATITRHEELLAEVVADAHGRVFKYTGDGVCAVFESPCDAVRAAVAGQLALGVEDWGPVGAVKVRMGVHTGEAVPHGADFLGRTMNRIGRVHAAAHGGQIVTSSATAGAVAGRLDHAVRLVPLGEVVLRGLGEAELVYQVVHPDLPRDFPPLRAETGAHRLPADVSELIGREHDVKRVLKAVEESRLVTITGAGGLGKTRLALRVASRLSLDLGGAAWWVELAPVADSGAVLGAVAHAVGGAPSLGGQDVLAGVVATLQARPGLVVLDNCEHVLDGVADLVHAVLAVCPDVRIVATSREPLGLLDEWVIGLDPLTLPASGAGFAEASASPAVALFERRGRAADEAFVLGPATVGAVVEICRRVEGVPLAIELAAARLRSFSVEEVARRLGERLRLLEPRLRGVPERQRSMRASIDWSYGLLEPEEAAMFERLSVFAGAFGVDAAVRVAGAGRSEYDVLDLLDRLVNRSMLIADFVLGETRFRMLDLLREFGLERLAAAGGLDEMAAAHTDYFLEVAERAATGVKGPAEPRWVAELDGDLAELRAVMDRAVAAADADVAARLALALFDYAFYRLRSEVGEWALAAAELLDAAGDERAPEVKAVAAFLAWHRGDVDLAGRLLDELPAGTDGWVAAQARATLAVFAGDVDAAIAGYAEAATIGRREGDCFRAAIGLSQGSFVRTFAGVGGRDEARALAAEALVAAEEAGSPTALAQGHWTMAMTLMRSDPAHAVEEFRGAINLAESVGNRLSASAAETMLQELEATASRRPPLANLRSAVETFEHWVESGSSPVAWTSARRASLLLVELDRLRDAALVFGAERAAPSKLPRRGPVGRQLDGVEADLADRLGPLELEALLAEGATLTMRQLAEHLVAVVDELEADPPDRG